MTTDLSDREKQILNLLMEQGTVTVVELSKLLSVSEVTIRSDLRNLEERSLLNRIHGGAVPSVHPNIVERQNLLVETKQRIAKAAADLVQDGDTIMIEAGTTTAMIPRYLFGKRDIHIITNSILAFTAAKSNPSIKLTVTGGEFRNSTESFVGSVAAEALKYFNVRLAFVGTDGFSLERGITTHLMEAGDIIKVMQQKAEQTVLLADSTKWGKMGAVSILPLKSASILITDKNLSLQAMEELAETNIRLLRV
ncbi:MAG: DeoR/GlpR transcriptional regulator [Spirochaetaceae bacterium]|nr:DeoR/GlpR transcriptional regulator [Spirochaetaceae bacterium]MBQ8561712.1 DeoR/GlpR transcriptional regulator [Spirochaetaceae bacterium]